MAKKIFKYPLNPGDLILPKNSKIIHAAIQFGLPYIWVECDPIQPLVTIDVKSFVTGADIFDAVAFNYSHLATFLHNDGRFLEHFYIQNTDLIIFK